MSAASTKNMTGTSPVLPRQIRTDGVRDAIERAVQLRLREEQRDAGQRQEQSATGKPFITSLRLMPPRYTPRIHASARPSTPTLS